MERVVSLPEEHLRLRRFAERVARELRDASVRSAVRCSSINGQQALVATGHQLWKQAKWQLAIRKGPGQQHEIREGSIELWLAENGGVLAVAAEELVLFDTSFPHSSTPTWPSGMPGRSVEEWRSYVPVCGVVPYSSSFASASPASDDDLEVPDWVWRSGRWGDNGRQWGRERRRYPNACQGLSAALSRVRPARRA